MGDNDKTTIVLGTGGCLIALFSVATIIGVFFAIIILIVRAAL